MEQQIRKSSIISPISFQQYNGAGKSTIIKLMTGIHSSTKGKLTIDGIEINNNEKELRKVYKNIGIVMQDNTFFNLSIRDNLLLSKADASQEEIKNAAKAAYIHEFIETLPNKYETIIGERGIKLSGGQKQRIALARLFLREPKIIILDEVTAALDKETERRENNSLEKFSKDRTVIIITNNLSNMMKVDRLVKLN